jgi:hypothetical protein
MILALARDPVDVMLMGEPFLTCLSPGDFNFFSAITNAADINKRVLFLWSDEGRVLGRCLLALTEEGWILTFHRYSHSKAIGFEKLVDRHVRELARAMGTGVTSGGKVPTLVARKWYDDGPHGLAGASAFLIDGSAFRSSLLDLPGERLVETVLAELGSNALDGTILRELIDLPELTVDHLIALVLERQDPQLRLTMSQHLRKRGDRVSAAELLRAMARDRRQVRALECGYNCALIDMLLPDQPLSALRVLRWTIPYGARRESDVTEGWWLYRAGEANWVLGRRQRAAKLFRRALAEGGSHHEQTMRDRLAELEA